VANIIQRLINKKTESKQLVPGLDPEIYGTPDKPIFIADESRTYRIDIGNSIHLVPLVKGQRVQIDYASGRLYFLPDL